MALRQAGAYIAATPGMTMAGYLHQLRTSPNWTLAARPAHRLDRRTGDRTDEQVMAGTWALTIDQIHQSHPLAIRLLRLLACYAPDRLPHHVRYGLLGTDQIQVREALAALAAYSMIDISSDRRYVSVHRLVQTVTRTQLSDADQAADHASAAALLYQALPADPAALESWPQYAELLPHARLVLAPDSPGMAVTIKYLNASGDYRTAKALQHTRADALERALGPEHPNTLTTRANLADWTRRAR